MARAKKQEALAQRSKGGGGSDGMTARNDPNAMKEKMGETAARKAQVEANKAEKLRKAEEVDAKAAREAAKYKRVWLRSCNHTGSDHTCC